MVVTVYQTATDGWDGLGLLTTLERATITQTISSTVGDDPASTPAESTPRVSIGAPAIKGTSTSTSTTVSTETSTSNPLPTATSITAPSETRTSNSLPSSTSTTAPSSAQLSTPSIVGIALGSVIAAVLLLVCLLFALGFRVQRAKLRRHITPADAPELTEKRPAVATSPGGPYGKAELADSAYIQKIERLHEGEKPELEGSTGLKSIWRFFSSRSSRRSGVRQGPAELPAEPLQLGPHELPGEGVLPPSCEERWNAQDITQVKSGT